MDALQKLKAKLAEQIQKSIDLATAGEIEASQEAEEAADTTQAQIAQLEKSLERQKSMQAVTMPAALPTESAPTSTIVNPDVDSGKAVAPQTEEEKAEEFNKSVNLIRYSNVDIDSLTTNDLCQYKAVTELYGDDYRRINSDQNRSFESFIRAKGFVTGEDDKMLRRMYWPLRYTAEMLKSGMSVERIKATMVEGVDVLGGYAVPPERGDMILRRSAGLTAVRAAGATVVRTNSKMIEWLEITNGNDQYPSALRGSYGSETQNPTEDNFDTGLKQIPVHIYTYKVPFSVSLLEDAENIVQIFTELVSDTLAMDEDRDFLIGDGANKARGILPGQLNANGLSEVNSGDANLVTMDGVKKLRRGVASQYRMAGRSSFIGNNDTGEDIELLKDADNRYFFPDGLTPNGSFLGGSWRESEALASPAANLFPLVFGDISGYAIVERLGLTIQRYNDSNTGVNKVEYHIRRRIGGDVIQPWKMAVQKIAA